jgi:hypothetical protein
MEEQAARTHASGNNAANALPRTILKGLVMM